MPPALKRQRWQFTTREYYGWLVGRVIFFGIGSGMVSPALGECPEEIEELGVIL